MTLMSENESVFYALLSYLDIDTKEETNALKELSSKFIINRFDPGDILWSMDTSSGMLHFVVDGAFAEYLQTNGQKQILRLYRKGKFAFSEDLLLYSKSPESFATCVVKGKVASVPKRVLVNVLDEYGLATSLLEALLSIALLEYRNSTYELLQTTGVNRINAALEQFPDLLTMIPRSELADYLGISRASLFRSLKKRKIHG